MPQGRESIFFDVIFYFYKQTSPPKTQKSRKTKRHIKAEQFNQDESNQISTRDIQIVPENFRLHFSHDRINHHPNHKYADPEPESDVRQDVAERVQERRNWSYKPSEGVIGSSEGKGRREEERVGKVVGGSRKGLASSMRIRGIYSQPVNKKGDKVDEKFNYSKEINNLMQKGFDLKSKGGQRNHHKALKTRGAPFQLPKKQRHRKGPKPLPPRHGPRDGSITIYLDLPMELLEDRFKRRKLGQTEKLSSFHTGDGILLKLNLYPRQRDLEDLHGGTFKEHKGGPLWRYNKKAERKSFGWFSKKKKKETNHWKECSIMGLNPHGKHITAKWKDENGDWIHAQRVAVKYLTEKK